MIPLKGMGKGKGKGGGEASGRKLSESAGSKSLNFKSKGRVQSRRQNA